MFRNHGDSTNCGIFCLQPGTTGEQKSKPTQNSVRELRGLGLSPDFVSCLSEHYQFLTP